MSAPVHGPGPPPDVRGRYEKKVKDYNFGSLIRTDARQEYSETNTIFGAHSFFSPPSSLSPPCSPSYRVASLPCPDRNLSIRVALQLRAYRYVRPVTSSRLLRVIARPHTCDASQFYVYEIARNRLGLNDKAHEIAKEEAAKEKEKAEKEKARAEREKAKKKKN